MGARTCLPFLILLALGGTARADTLYQPAGMLGGLADGPVPSCLTERLDPVALEPPCAPLKPDPSLSRAARAEVLIRRAEAFHQDDRRAGTDAELAEALALAPESGRVWHFSARLKFSRGDRDGARADVSRALALDPSDPNIWATSASLAANTSDALRDLARALALDPGHEFALTYRIDLGEGLRDEVTRERDFAALAAVKPDHLYVASRRAAAALAAGRPRAALADYDAMIDRAPRSVPLLIKRVVLLQMLGEHERALGDYGAILGTGDARPRYALGAAQASDLYFGRATSLHALGRGEEARADVLRALRGADVPGLLRMQVYLRHKGFDEVPVTGETSPALVEAASACMLNPVCGMPMRRI